MRDPLDRPNVILINCDDLGYGDLGCYGSTVNRTPHLDRLASEGTRLTDFYMAAPVCTPSRAAMMTGCYAQRVSMGEVCDGSWVLFPGQNEGLNPDEITIATMLKQQGYVSKLIGKWHLGDQKDFLPTNHGFDQYFGLPYSNDMGRQTGREHLPPLPLVEGDQVIQQQPDQAALTERYVEHSLRYMRENRDRPFFIYLAHMYVHLPLYAPQYFLNRSQNGAYGAAVECIDWSVGMIMNELRRLGLDRNTVVIFTSDNGSRGRGGGSNAPLRGTKGTTYEGGQRLPCIVRWANQVPAGVSCNQITTAMDFLPTVAALTGGSAPNDRTLDGRNISSTLMHETGAASPHDAFYYYLRNELQAVRFGNWKLHLQRHELYDLSVDVGEERNRIAEHPKIVDQIEGLAEACQRELGDTVTETVGSGVRPVGRVEDASPMTEYDPDHPYMVAMYDLKDAG